MTSLFGAVLKSQNVKIAFWVQQMVPHTVFNRLYLDKRIVILITDKE